MEENLKVSQSKQNEISCINCGAKLTFAPGTLSLKCEYCNAENPIEIDENEITKAKEEIDYLSFINNQGNIAAKIEVTTVKCQTCGAETSFGENVVSSQCDFCGSPLVSADAHKTQVIEPRGILPFKIDTKQSIELYQTWLKKLWFAPNKLKTYARQSEKLAGIYIPYWTYDSDTNTQYSGKRGDDYQETDSSGKSQTRTVTKTDWTFVSGRVSRFFDDVLVPASESLPLNYVEKLEPWDLENLLPYDTKYLSGFKSETYRVDLSQGFDKAKNKMEVVIQGDIRRDIGGDRQQILSSDSKFNEITFKHVLLPIWLSAYRFNNKAYRFMINGRTGEVQGERPWSWIKITLASLAALAVIGALYYFFGSK
jgi:DNA-directed RNA polymerase subunit M/transcription elongation factor TFIIS